MDQYLETIVVVVFFLGVGAGCFFVHFTMSMYYIARNMKLKRLRANVKKEQRAVHEANAPI